MGQRQMTVKGNHYEMHSNAVRQKVLHQVKTQEKSIAIIAELNGLPASTVCTWVKLAGLDRGRPAYKSRRDRKKNINRPGDYEIGAVNRLLNTWRLR